MLIGKGAWPHLPPKAIHVSAKLLDSRHRLIHLKTQLANLREDEGERGRDQNRRRNSDPAPSCDYHIIFMKWIEYHMINVM